MALGGSDLNLLLSLKVLLEEGNVTRAGQRLRMGQSTMSAALARLRRRFDDELLVRSGRDYELTPFARDLLPDVQRAVRLMGSALQLEEGFDPATSERTFRLVMSDYAIAVVHKPLVRLVEAEAPGVRLRINHLTPDAKFSDHTLIDNDVLVAPQGFGFVGDARPLWRDRMIVLADRRNSRLTDGRLTLDDLAELPHAVAHFGPTTMPPEERTLGELGIERRVALQVYGFLPLLFVIRGTDMVAVLPEKLAHLMLRENDTLVIVEPPFGEVVLAESYWYAHHRLADPAHRWLFGRLEAVHKELTRTAGPS
jgi:DNA-binding transcriptional LysR family regulator